MIHVFCRPPVPGATKTRLIPALGAGGAAALSRAMTADVVATARATGAPLHLVVAGAPDDPCLSAFGLPLEAQPDGDLGHRLASALRHGGIAIGSDAPTLPAAILSLALAHLSTHDVVFAPAFDGGYVLVGCRDPSGIFEGIPWSSPETFAASVERVRSLGRSLSVLPFWYDVDTPADLSFLRTHLRALPATVAPQTRAFFAEPPHAAPLR